MAPRFPVDFRILADEEFQTCSHNFIWLVVWNIFFHILGIIIPTDFHFQRGRSTTNQLHFCMQISCFFHPNPNLENDGPQIFFRHGTLRGTVLGFPRHHKPWDLRWLWAWLRESHWLRLSFSWGMEEPEEPQHFEDFSSKNGDVTKKNMVVLSSIDVSHTGEHNYDISIVGCDPSITLIYYDSLLD